MGDVRRYALAANSMHPLNNPLAVTSAHLAFVWTAVQETRASPVWDAKRLSFLPLHPPPSLRRQFLQLLRRCIRVMMALTAVIKALVVYA